MSCQRGTVTNLTIPYAVKEDVEAIAIERWNKKAGEQNDIQQRLL